MMYCVRCGDPIEKDELVCDKCGLRFELVHGERGTTVYMNQAKAPQKKAVKKKKKKMPVGGIIGIVLGSLALLFLIGTLLIGTLIVGSGALLVGAVLLLPDDELEVYDETASSNSQFDPIVYDSIETQNSIDNDNLSAAVRAPYTNIIGDGNDTVTVMVYMNGSDLESVNGCATEDLKEMTNAALSENVNVVVQTGGTKKWKNKNISGKHSQRFVVKNGKLVLVDDSLGQLEISDPDNLADFIKFCNTNYPANRNILIFWNHGGGVVYGYGYDEIVKDDDKRSMTLDQIRQALDMAGIKFEMIGFDACLMGGIETTYALGNYADYLIASEDFEAGTGWEYQNWLTLLGYNSSTPMTKVGKLIVDDFIVESQGDDSEGILAVVDLRYANILFDSWKDFAYANEADLLAQNYNMEMSRTDRAGKWFDKKDGTTKGGWLDSILDSLMDYDLSDYYYAVDLMALANTLSTEESNALASALKYSLVYCATTSGDSHMTGLSVTLPYGDTDFYDELDDVFLAIGFGNEYIEWLAKFANGSDYEDYDWNESDWSGWGDDSWYSDDDDDYYDWDDYDWDSFWDEYDEDSYYYDDYEEGNIDWYGDDDDWYDEDDDWYDEEDDWYYGW